MSSELQVVARYAVRPGREAAVARLLEELAHLTRAERGNIAFDCYTGMDPPSQIALLERYISREAFAEHRRSEYFTRIVLQQIAPMLMHRVVELFDAPSE